MLTPDYRLLICKTRGLSLSGLESLEATTLSVTSPNPLSPTGVIPPEILQRLERESTLKRMLFRKALWEEGERFMREPTMVRDPGSLLNSCYEFTMNCPLVTKRGKGTEAKMDEFILLLPTLNKHVKAGTKRNIIAALTDFFNGVFVALKRTRLEQEYADQIKTMFWEGLLHDPQGGHSSGNEGGDGRVDQDSSADDVNSHPAGHPAPDGNATAGEKEERRRKRREATKAKRRRSTRMRIISGMVMADLAESGGATRLVTILREAKTTSELPSPYREFVEVLKVICAPELPKVVEDPAKVEKLRSIHAKLPQSLIVNLFRFTNPLKLVTSLSHLLLISPFGTRSLLQRIMIVLSDLSRTEREQREVAEQLPSFLLDSMLAYIDGHYPFDSLADSGVVDRRVVTLSLGLDSANLLPEKTILLCTRFFSLEIRRRQKTEYIEVIESPQILSILKHLFPVLQEPFMDMYSAGDLPNVSCLFELLMLWWVPSDALYML